MDIANLKKIIDRVKASRFTRLDARVGEVRFGFTCRETVPLPAASLPAGKGNGPAASPEAGELVTVKAPLVGRFYSTETAGNVPRALAGTRVKKGQKIGMIEAMNLEHVLVAEVEGILKELLVDDGEPVQYGQPLFKIQTGRS